MQRITEEAAASAFDEMLADVECRGVSVAITRHGRTVAVLGPPSRSSHALRGWLDANPPDDEWADNLRALRALVGNAPGCA